VVGFSKIKISSGFLEEMIFSEKFMVALGKIFDLDRLDFIFYVAGLGKRCRAGDSRPPSGAIGRDHMPRGVCHFAPPGKK
jgi:hypothetical protein